MFVALSVIGILLVIAAIVLTLWWTISQAHYDNVYLKPGDEYEVGDDVYTIPAHLTIRGDKTVRKLKEQYLLDQKELLRTLTTALKENDIEYWVACGTLLGYVRHQTFLPWDDDVDLHTHWSNREYMFSKDFNTMLNHHGLESYFIMTSSVDQAFYDGAMVRVRKKGTKVPSCDIFFVKEMDDDNNMFAKIDGWNKSAVTQSKKERWHRDLLFPTEERTLDGLTLQFPKNPEAVVKNMYGGEKVLTEIVARKPWASHRFLYVALPFLFHNP